LQGWQQQCPQLANAVPATEEKGGAAGWQARAVAWRIAAFPFPDAAMPCFVYASLRKHDSYLWLAERDAFDVLPEPLLLLLGELRFVMEVQLDEQRKLPNEDTLQVLDHLRTQGWHLQVPQQETLAAANHPAYRRELHGDRDD
jgi:uncharacterized protein YcgL (UPF0745 family)